MPIDPFRPAALLCVAASLVACAAPGGTASPKYQPPTDPASARLVLRGVVQPGDVYLVRLLGDGERCADPQLVGSGNAVQHPDTTRVDSGRPATLAFQVVKANNQSCVSRWTFTPAAGRSYLLTGFGLPNGCVALVADLSDPEHPKPEPTALHRNPPGGPGCLPIAQSKPLPAAARAASAGDAVLRDGAITNDLQGLIAP